MRNRLVEDLLSLLSGAGLGAAVMYLFDPDSGPKRRHHLGETASDAMYKSGEALSSSFYTLSDKASHLGHDLSERARELAHDVAARTSTLAKTGVATVAAAGANAADKGRRMASRKQESISDRAHALTDRAREYLPSFHREEPSHVPSQTAAAFGLLALGAGVMFLMDPQRGRSRRAKLRDKVVRGVHETGDAFRLTGRYVKGRARGLAAQTRSRLHRHPERPTDEQLAARVRSELGHLLPNTGGFSVRAEQGRIILTGTLPSEDIDVLVASVSGIRGVEYVDNQLQTNTNAPNPTAM